MRVAEPGFDADLIRQFLVFRELGAIIKRDRLSGLGWQLAEAGDDGAGGFIGGFGVLLVAHDEAGFALDKGEEIAFAKVAEQHQIAFPVAELHAGIGGFGPFVDRRASCNRLSPLLEIAPPASGFGEGQVTIKPLIADFGPVDIAIDCLGAEFMLCPVKSEPAGDLFRRPPHSKMVIDMAHQQVPALDAASSLASGHRHTARRDRVVAAFWQAVTPPFPTDRRP